MVENSASSRKELAEFSIFICRKDGMIKVIYALSFKKLQIM